MNLDRNEWLRALSAHPAPVLHALADRLAADCEVRLVGLPQAGLGLLTLLDGALHEPYYLGEFPLSICHLQLIFPDGSRAEGGAQIMADDAQLARSLAILDAVLAAKLSGWEQVASHVEAGALQRSKEERRRGAMLGATRVDFALLGNIEEDGDES